MAEKTHVVVIGGGFAGVMAANRLTQREDVTVTMVNPRPNFVARLRLHQLVAGSHPAIVDYGEVLAKKVRLVVDTATRIDAPMRNVTLANGETVGYDYLIYAVGSGSTPTRVPGANEFAYPIHNLEAAQRLRAVLNVTPPTAAVTVVGSGPTGIETAAELSALGRHVTLVCGGTLAPYLHPRARRTASKRLAKLGVNVLEGANTKVAAVTHHAVRLGDGCELPSQITIWTAGFGVPELAAQSGLSTDARGRLLTDETLTCVDDKRIIAAGDAAAPSDLPFRMSAYVAYCLGAHAADTVLSRIAGEKPEPVSLLFAAMCISLGRKAGIYQFFNKSDTATRFYIRGRAGAKLKELSSNFSIKHLVKEARKPGSHTWLKNSTRQKLLQEKRNAAQSAAVPPTVIGSDGNRNTDLARPTAAVGGKK